MREKILYGVQVPNPNSPGGLSNRLIGAHSPKIKSRPDFSIVEVVSNNSDGTTTVKLIKQFPDGSFSKRKYSTLAADSWSDQKIIDTTNQVASTATVAASSRGDGSTLHRQTFDGVEWEVGTPTTSF